MRTFIGHKIRLKIEAEAKEKAIENISFVAIILQEWFEFFGINRLQEQTTT
jgi:N-acetylglutamate synthase-like GNAT family acetyltransferase